MILYDKIKLIVWDLDDTFWKGTLSEEHIEPIASNIELVKKLAQRGIVSAICSKNDYEDAKNKLEELEIWNYFVFNSIDWTPKGQRVKQIITDMALRPGNVLFIDDNPTNLKEVSYFSDGIMVNTPQECLDELKKRVTSLGKDDANLSRLKQYKVLETKHNAKLNASSNEEFLKSCHVSIALCDDCDVQIDRIAELIQRSNQLNYTKLRENKNLIQNLLTDTNFKCQYVTAKDDFGDYGIVGFYALNIPKKELKHFLFSCRTMGMGIEQFIYSKLGFPKLQTVGEVAIELNKNSTPDWITIKKEVQEIKSNKSNSVNYKILFKGPCDTDSSLAFIQNSDCFDCEFTFVNSNGLTVSSQNTTYHALESLKLSSEDNKRLKDDNPFWDEKLYKTSMFDGNYDIVFFSLFKEAVSGLYKNRDTGISFVFDDWYIDAACPSNWKRYIENPLLKINTEQMQKFSNNYIYQGRILQKNILDNIIQIRNKLPERCLLVLSVPTSFEYVDTVNKEKNDRALYNQELLKILNEGLKEYSNIHIIDYTEFANSPEDFLETSNHFTKKVYYKVAEEYKKIIADWCGINVKNKSKLFVCFYEGLDAIKKKLRKNKKLVKFVRKFRKK